VAENYEWWAAKGKQLAREVDFISVHVYPVWEGKDINEGMSYTLENIAKVRAALPESKIVISEAGWATVGSEFGERASEEKQQQYFSQLSAWSAKMNITIFFFEAFDEDWKGDPGNSMGAEKHWGLFTIDRKPKKAVKQYFDGPR
jgi:exo-beta-1,3-glucanase (GH17 family)